MSTVLAMAAGGRLAVAMGAWFVGSLALLAGVLRPAVRRAARAHALELEEVQR